MHRQLLRGSSIEIRNPKGAAKAKGPDGHMVVSSQTVTVGKVSGQEAAIGKPRKRANGFLPMNSTTFKQDLEKMKQSEQSGTTKAATNHITSQQV